ncbi:uncharacterized protein BP5553_00795 [Venustampulla echinocandica]|uniref:Nitrogen regulatory protein areA GATA-like domain-containing protein n=1 Tax=Venustampulla echinocandica TaxID=2656787 RepID=A0A370TZ65_9HELO|nr:uncharacterized protein BP5553_00795 [Venustampulla echinocandica]RDL40816.1 hypothetical protein BP5553_00795 [Venustampulla echinocandica]
MSTILPKGIVVNSPQGEDSIERIGAKPLDLAEIAGYWKVYTTTKRRLLDPTAERLENYWWRIWGSRKRELEAATVARLFRYISHGPTFVPLRGPANRDEGTPPLENQARYAPAASSATTLHHPTRNRQSTVTSSATSRAPTAMPHPILKKTRGPSTTGPRPTARFVSPHDSEEERDSSSSAGSNSHVVVQPPSPDGDNVKLDGKLPASGRKKPGFVASTAGKKKRPVISRRQSSQTSQSSTDRSSTGKSPTGKSPTDNRTADSIGSTQASLQRTQPETSEQEQGRPKKTTQSKFQEELSPPHRSSETTPASKDQGPSNGIHSKNYMSPDSSGRESQMIKPEQAELDAVEQGHSHHPRPTMTGKGSNEHTGSEVEQRGLHREPLEHAQPHVPIEKSPRQEASPSLENDQGHTHHKTPKPRSSGSNETMDAPRPFKSAASLAPTLTAATAHIALGDPIGNGSRHSPTPPSPKAETSKSKDQNQRRQADMFAKRPVQPIADAVVPAPAGPLSKSKSQLTLLLEKDRARSGNHVSSSSKR